MHAKFERRGNHLFVTDASSLNGVYRRLVRNVPARLEPGHVPSLGPVLAHLHEQLVVGHLDQKRDEVLRGFEVVLPGGGALLGVDGVCIISHGSSSARAIVNAVALAADCVRGDIVGRLKEATSGAG